MRKEIFLKKASQIIAQEEATCGILSRVIDIAILRMGYIRIEPEAGGRCSKSETRGANIGTNMERVPAKDDYRQHPSPKKGKQQSF